MNAKHAKQLRREAVKMAAYMIDAGRSVSLDRVYAPQSHLSSTIINRPDSLRGIYRHLKKHERQTSVK